MISSNDDRFIILDDRFPRLSSPFRIAEYNFYMEHFPSAEVYSTALHGNGEEGSLREYAALFPQFRSRISKYDPGRRYHGKLAYTLFLQNAFFFLDMLEQFDLPFIFTLYEGGGFHLHHPLSDHQLRVVCSSQLLRKVIAPSVMIRDYLIEKKFCEPKQIELVYGSPILSSRLMGQASKKKCYNVDKSTFDVCFVAYKYTSQGVDKGYDVYVKVAKVLSRIHNDIYFHVVGNFDGSDIDVSDLSSRIAFYGKKPTDFFPEFYSRMDVILSPNIPFSPDPGSFDSFPTTSCVEAGFCGVAVFCTDHLNQNILFKDGEEIVLISRDVHDIVDTIAWYREHSPNLYDLSRKGKEAFTKLFSIENTMTPRLRLISEYI